MSNDNFQAEDWIYIPDPMGRIGQGYYRNRNNLQQTITVNEYESRRKGAQLPHIKNNEQNINIYESPQSNATTRLESSGATDSTLTAWDNPVMGEQNVSLKSQSQREKPVQTSASAKLEETKRQEEEERKRKEQQEVQARSQSNQGGDGGSHSAQGAVSSSGKSDSEGTGNAKVICSEMVRRGLMRERERKACTLYAFSRLPSSFMNGYHFWAVPYVRLMRKYDWACGLIHPFVIHRTREVRYRLGHVSKGSWIGKVICALHDPLCTIIGKCVSAPDYKTLYGNDYL